METEIEKTLISCIVSRQDGVPLQEINEDFKILTGYSIPFLSLGYPNIISFLSTIKDVYFEKDKENNDIIIVDSLKSRNLNQLVKKQRPMKRKLNFIENSPDLNFTMSSIHSEMSSHSSYNVPKRRRAMLLEKNTLDMLTPIMHGYQLMGDDIFLEVAEQHLLVPIRATAPKRCGLCITGQTIKDLIDNINQQTFLPYRVAVLIGLTDLLNGKKSTEMIRDMDLLITELQNRKIQATLFTLPKLDCIPKHCYSSLQAFNDYIVSKDGTKFIKVMDLEHYHSWMAPKEYYCSNNSKFLLREMESEIVLFGLQDYFNLINRELDF